MWSDKKTADEIANGIMQKVASSHSLSNWDDELRRHGKIPKGLDNPDVIRAILNRTYPNDFETLKSLKLFILDNILEKVSMDPKLLMGVAQADEDRHVRLAAVKHIRDQEFLKRIVFADDYEGVVEFSLYNITDEAFLKEAIANNFSGMHFSNYNSIVHAAFRNIKDQDFLKDVVMYGYYNRDAHSAALHSINDDEQEFFKRVASSYLDDDLKKSAIARITDARFLEGYNSNRGGPISRDLANSVSHRLRELADPRSVYFSGMAFERSMEIISQLRASLTDDEAELLEIAISNRAYKGALDALGRLNTDSLIKAALYANDSTVRSESFEKLLKRNNPELMKQLADQFLRLDRQLLFERLDMMFMLTYQGGVRVEDKIRQRVMSELIKAGKISGEEANLTDMVLQRVPIYLPHLLNRLFEYENKFTGLNLVYSHILEKVLMADKTSIEKLRDSLNRGSHSDIEKSVVAEVLAKSISDDGKRNLFLKILENGRDLVEKLKMLDTMIKYSEHGTLTDSELASLINADNFKAEFGAIFNRKVYDIIKIAPEDEAALAAMGSREFLEDLLNYNAVYNEDKVRDVFMKLVNAYFKDGIEGMRRYKFGHGLADVQLPKQFSQKLKHIDAISVEVPIEGNARPYDAFISELRNYISHKKNLSPASGFGILDEAEKHSAHIMEVCKSLGFTQIQKPTKARAEMYAALAREGRIDSSNFKFFTFQRALAALGSIGFIEDNIIDRLESAENGDVAEQKSVIDEIRGMPQIKEVYEDMKSLLSVSEDYRKTNAIYVQALAELLSILAAVSNKNKADNIGTVTANVTFDLGTLLTFGRYGTTGAGNCQISTNDEGTNQGIMAMIGDANQFLIEFRKLGTLIGFMQIHALQSENGPLLLFEHSHPYTNIPALEPAMKDAAAKLAKRIEEDTGMRCYAATDSADELRVRIPPSYIGKRYTDFLQGYVDGDGENVSLRASRYKDLADSKQ